jgi:excinuclease UvrABC nuclease subunit
MPTRSNRNRKAWVYRLYHENGELLYVGKGINPTKRIQQHAGVQPWFHQVDHSKTILTEFPTEFEAYQAEEEAIKNEHPKYNLVHHVNNDTNQRMATPTDTIT